jgi:hypothetical protein
MPILCATYRPPKFYYKIPEDWDVKDIEINRGQLYYKGEKKKVPCHEMEDGEDTPEAPLKIEDEGDYDFLFSDEEE